MSATEKRLSTALDVNKGPFGIDNYDATVFTFCAESGSSLGGQALLFHVLGMLSI